MRSGTCEIDGCKRKQHARKMCAYHYRNWLAEKNGAAQCAGTRCSSLATIHGYCRTHYEKRRRAEIRDGEVAAKRCGVKGCKRRYDAGGYCNLHYGRARRNSGDPGPAQPMRGKPGEPYRTGDGYIEVRVNGRKVRQHRHVMEQALGRPLFKGETVHHKNGRRDDNRLSNLELWVKPQPSGQRVEDLVAWVADRYPDLLRRELETRT